MRNHASGPYRYGQWSLVGTLVAVAILIILAALYIPRIARRHAETPTAPATPQERALGAACGEYVSQMNQAVTLYKMDHDDKPPTSLDQLKKYSVTDEMLHAEGCSYQLDPATGTVTESAGGRAAPGGVTIPNIPGASGG